MPFRTGENVGPYRIIEQLGQGGMATVFKAYHPALDRNVAIKAMHPAFMEDPQFLARFKREARVVASLDHPNIVPVHDFSEHAGQPYLVMKYVEGHTLKAILETRGITQPEILHIVNSVGAALSYAHRRGVLHRDIKPSNILLTPDDQVYLADFGLARIAEAGQSSMSGDQLLGTPHYISPEQARGERDLDQGTDVYSLGIVLYQLTVGRVPFSADTPFSIIHDHIYTPLPLPRKSNPNLSEALENVLLKALAKDRGDRFASVDDLVRAFEAAWTEVPLAKSEQVTAVRRDGGLTAAPAARASPALAGAPLAGVLARRRWPWVLGGLAVSSLCLLTFAVAASRDMRAESSGTSPRASEGEAARAQAIQAARIAAESNPQDPQARLELAHLLEEAGMISEAYQELLKAGELFLKLDAFTPAAETLLGAARLFPARVNQDSLLSELLTQALFLGAPTGEMLAWVQATAEQAPEFPGLVALEARARLFMGEGGRARELVEGVLAERPADPLAGAVVVDVLQMEGKPGEAKEQAQRMLTRPRLPDWLRAHLRELEASLPPR